MRAVLLVAASLSSLTNALPAPKPHTAITLHRPAAVTTRGGGRVSQGTMSNTVWPPRGRNASIPRRRNPATTRGARALPTSTTPRRRRCRSSRRSWAAASSRCPRAWPPARVPASRRREAASFKTVLQTPETTGRPRGVCRERGGSFDRGPIVARRQKRKCRRGRVVAQMPETTGRPRGVCREHGGSFDHRSAAARCARWPDRRQRKCRRGRGVVLMKRPCSPAATSPRRVRRRNRSADA